MRRPLVLLLAALLLVVLLSAPAAADTRVGGTVVIGPDETVGDISATGATVVVQGTVDGDLHAYGGDVRVVEGAEVTGIVRVYAGTVTIDGAVGENALANAGGVTVGEAATVDRSVGAVGGDVSLAGRVGGDATVLAGTVTLAETGSVEGDLTHRGTLDDEGGSVDGVTQGMGDLALLPPLGLLTTVLEVLLFVGTLLLGTALLAVAPRFADTAARTARVEPLRTAAVGLAVTVAVCLAVGLLALTVVGLPLAVAGLALGAVLAWVAAVYGRYAVGDWVLSYAGVEHRPLALLVGVVGVALVGLLPYVGPGVQAAVFLLGVGVLALGLRRLYGLVSRNRGGLADI